LSVAVIDASFKFIELVSSELRALKPLWEAGPFHLTVLRTVELEGGSARRG
jgi:hypothetical protein